MKNHIKTEASSLGLIVFIIIISTVTSVYAADVTLAWDPNCNEYPDLIGYNIYYKAGSSVLADPEGADIIYIPLTESNFDPERPNYQITDLLNGVRYYFTIAAVYSNDGIQDQESAMSNEVTAARKSGDDAAISGNSNSDSAAGCFISDLF